MSETEKTTPDIPATGDQPQPRSGLALRIVLFVSLALNLAVAGLVVGSVLHQDRDGPPKGPPRVERIAGVLGDAMNRQERRELGRAIWGDMRKTRPDRDEVKAEFDQILKALRSDPYDGSVVETTLNKQLDDAMHRQEVGQKFLIQMIDGMDRKERLAFADRLQAALNDVPWDKGAHRGPDKAPPPPPDGQ